MDLALGTINEVPGDLCFVPSFEYDSVLIVAVDHPPAKLVGGSLEDIASYPLILPPTTPHDLANG